MSGSKRKQDKEPGGLLAASGLKERLVQVRKRKRVFDGQMVNLEAVRQRLAAEQQRTRGG